MHQSSGELSKKVEEKLAKTLRRYDKEQRMLIKDISSESAVMEEVFDKRTLLTLYRLLNQGVFDYLNGVVSAGKESRIYWGVHRDGSDLAVKIYLVSTAEFKKRLQYIEGDPRFIKRIRKGMSNLVNLWARKELANLKAAYNAGVSCPKPIAVDRNILVTEFIGSGGRPSSRLIESDVGKEDYRKLISIVKKLYRSAHLIHADLSEYNVFKTDSKLMLFDFGSAVDVEHPLAKQFLIRDITNVNRFFEKRGIRTLSVGDVLKKVMGDEL